MVDVSIQQVPGFQVAGVHAGLKKSETLDFALFASDRDCAAGAVFTKNTVKAACVHADIARMRTHAGKIRAIAVNTVSANACTGEQGLKNAEEMARLAAEKIGCAPEQVLVLSTGVIGTQLPMAKIASGTQLAYDALGDHWEDAACAIMTTDTRPKLASTTVTLDSGKSVTVAGVSKGSGMIAPNMATMLGLLFTDAALTPDQTQNMLAAANENTFNRIVVDGDMSTNDTVFLLANGASGTALETEADHAAFLAALTEVCRKLAQDVVRDGEGASKFISLYVQGAANDADARQIAATIATSALVKTAFFGCDANWGRIIAAAGRAGVPFDPSLSELWFVRGESNHADPGNGALLLFRDGTPTDYDEAEATSIVKEASVSAVLKCGLGDGQATVWTCDLSYDYVRINGEYRT